MSGQLFATQSKRACVGVRRLFPSAVNSYSTRGRTAGKSSRESVHRVPNCEGPRSLSARISFMFAPLQVSDLLLQTPHARNQLQGTRILLHAEPLRPRLRLPYDLGRFLE